MMMLHAAVAWTRLQGDAHRDTNTLEMLATAQRRAEDFSVTTLAHAYTH
jgi:hypothetical protein